MTNSADATFIDHVMDALQEAETMAENVQAQPDSIEEHDKVAIENVINAPLSSPTTPIMPRNLPVPLNLA